ncbi:MAG: molecular chaperone HtpG [Flavobacteriales bacterium]|nr:molecular chaperone HtpG [Flavobacteriales bacterium]
MEKQTGTINVQTENIFPIIKKFLYSDHEIFLRELVSNSVDACQKVKTLATIGEIKADTGALQIEVSVDKEAGTLIVRDNGIGMTAEEVDKYINQIAFSGAEEFVSKYKDAQIIGHFGLGFYSAFMVSSKVEIHTLSHRAGSTSVQWECDGSPNFTLEAGSKTEPGTEIILHIAEDSIEFLEEDRIEAILTKYCKFMPISIRFGEKSEWIEDASGEKDENENVKRSEVKVPNIINNTEPAWTKKPADLKDEDYKEFYHELYPMTFDEPLFNIHVNVDYPFNLTGILYFPRLKNNMEVQKNKVQLYCNQVYITDEVKNILPDFLTLLHGVIDSPDIPLNVSRSYLQEDSNVKKISSHITKKVADRLQSMFNADRADFEKKWDDIGVFIQYGMLTDDKFREKANGFALYKGADEKYYTLEELKEAVKETQKDKNGDIILLYTHNKNEQHAFVESASERGYVVVEMDGPLTSHFISHIESKNQGLHFKRVDADILDKLIEKDEIQTSALSEEQSKEVKTLLDELISDKTFQVSFANMSPSDAPFVIVQNEFMRRMKEQSAMGGGGFYGTLPDSYNIVANSNHPLLSKLAEGQEVDSNKEIARQAIDLALLSKGLLKGSELTRFIKKSFEKLS